MHGVQPRAVGGTWTARRPVVVGVEAPAVTCAYSELPGGCLFLPGHLARGRLQQVLPMTRGESVSSGWGSRVVSLSQTRCFWFRFRYRSGCRGLWVLLSLSIRILRERTVRSVAMRTTAYDVHTLDIRLSILLGRDGVLRNVSDRDDSSRFYIGPGRKPFGFQGRPISRFSRRLV